MAADPRLGSDPPASGASLEADGLLLAALAQLGEGVVVADASGRVAFMNDRDRGDEDACRACIRRRLTASKRIAERRANTGRAARCAS